MSMFRSFPLLSFAVFVSVAFTLLSGAQIVERPSWNTFSEEYRGVGVGYRVGVQFFRHVAADLKSGYPFPELSVQQGDTLPDGLRLTSSGYLVGTPTVSGSFSFTLVAVNRAGIAKKRVTLHLRPPFGVASYSAGDLNAAILDAQVFLNSTSCPVAQIGLGSPHRETLSFLPALADAITCYQRKHALPVTGTLTSDLLSHFIASYHTRFIPGDFVLPSGTTASGAPQWRTPTSTRTLFLNDPVAIDLRNLLIHQYPSPSFRIRAGVLPAGLSLQDDGTITGTPVTLTSTTVTVSAENTSGFDLLYLTFSINESGYTVSTTHPTIRQAQRYLNGTPCPVAQQGAGSPGQETSYFGQKT
ncbi:MAG: hypothetical protein OXB96_01310, partial [Candidatus Kaiserbacteria bacterium]|nr:hypothetical protein [Candidatus Kaiserbacteria bacterium]